MDDNFVRYGLLWQGPETPVSVPMPDGYWTPWHVAQLRIERLQRERDEARAVLRQEADYCQRYADKYRDSDPERSARHQARADRLRAALGGERLAAQDSRETRANARENDAAQEDKK